MTSNIPTGKTYIDKGWAWVILIANTTLMILIQGNERSFGIFMVELQREFHSSAAVVSSILSTQAAAFSLSTFLVLNCLLRVFPLRLLVIIGCLCCTLCFILDSQATKIEFVTIFHIINGVGSAFTYGPAIVLIGEYFIKYRGTAYAFSSCGSSVGQFLLSPLFSYLISEYGMKGALLINAGIYFQCVMFAMLLRPTSFFHRAPIKIRETGEEDLFTEAISDNMKIERTCMINAEEEHESTTYQVELRVNVNVTTEETNFERLQDNSDEKKNSSEEINSLQDEENIHNCDNQAKKANIENSDDLKNEIMDLSFESYTTEKNGGKHGECFRKCILSNFTTIFTNIDFKLFKSPIFLTYFFGNTLGQLTSAVPQFFFPSHAKDMGLDRKEGMLFVAIAGFADLGGRILTTLIADQKRLNRPRFLGCVLIIHGIVACFIPFLNNFHTFAAYCVIYGVSKGIIFAISTTILADYIGVERLSQGLGLTLLFEGFTMAGAFLLMGFIREFGGSYIPGFMATGVCLMVSGVIFCTEACIKYEKQSRG